MMTPEPIECATLRAEKAHLLALRDALTEKQKELDPSDPLYISLQDAIDKIDALIGAIVAVGVLLGCDPAV